MTVLHLPKVIKLLDSLYRQSLAGEKRSNLFFNQQWETSASSAYISDLKIDYGIQVSSEFTKSPVTGSRYKVYWINDSEMPRVLAFLQSYGLHCTSEVEFFQGGAV